MLAIVLALGTSACYGVANFLVPVFLRRHAFATALLTGQVAALVACAVLLAGSGEPFPALDGLALGLLAGLGNAVGLAGFYEAVRFGPLSVAAPIGATSAVLPVVVGVVGGDALGAPQLAGIVLCIAGAALASRRVSTTTDDPAWNLPRCVFFASVSALGLGTLLATLPSASERGGQFWALFDARMVIVSLFCVLIAARGQRFALPIGMAPVGRPARALLAVPGILLLTGTLLYLLAAERGQLSVVAVCGSLAPLVTVGLAVGALGERVSRMQLAGVVGAVAGVCLIAV